MAYEVVEKYGRYYVVDTDTGQNIGSANTRITANQIASAAEGELQNPLAVPGLDQIIKEYGTNPDGARIGNNQTALDTMRAGEWGIWGQVDPATGIPENLTEPNASDGTGYNPYRDPATSSPLVPDTTEPRSRGPGPNSGPIGTGKFDPTPPPTGTGGNDSPFFNNTTPGMTLNTVGGDYPYNPPAGIPLNPMVFENPMEFSPYGTPAARFSNIAQYGGLPRSTGPWNEMGGYYGGNPYVNPPDGYNNDNLNPPIGAGPIDSPWTGGIGGGYGPPAGGDSPWLPPAQYVPFPNDNAVDPMAAVTLPNGTVLYQSGDGTYTTIAPTGGT